jgi:excisionase family DNA binding protein
LDVKGPIVAALRAQAVALEASARALRAQADALEQEPEAPEAPLYLTIADAAQRFNVSKRTIGDWLVVGLPSVRRGRVRRIPIAEATAWLRDQSSH